MSAVIVAGVAAAAIGAYASNKASKENAKGVKKGLDQSLALTNGARRDAIALFDMSAKKANLGLQASMDFYKQNAQKRMQPFVQGNQAAQNVIGMGAKQANNAILGLPVDMSFTNQPQVQADYSGIQGAVLPQMGTSFAENEAQRVAAEQAAADAAAPGIAAAAKAKAKAAEREQENPLYKANPKNALNNVKNDFNKVKKVFGGLF